MNTNKLFIIAGESSGDRRAAEVIRELRTMNPSYEFEGLGGTFMAEEGVSLMYDLASVAVLGFSDVVKKYFFFRKLFYQTLRRIKESKPAAVILVDYPGFNLRLAKKIKALNIPVIYYISPQVWAWAPWRVRTISRIIDKMLVILPFEVDIYKKTNLKVEFVGHPLVGKCKAAAPGEAIKQELNIQNANPVITLLPGSRESEVKRILPIMVKAAALMAKTHPTATFVISQSPHLKEQLFKKIIRTKEIAHILTTRSIHDVITVADFCWVASGTATLETALHKKPFIILYKAAWLTYVFAKHLITLPYIGLVNVLAGHKIIPEFLQNDAHPETIAHETSFILKDKSSQEVLIQHLEEVRKKLGPEGAAQRAAQSIVTFLAER